jgi:hypothetical protein
LDKVVVAYKGAKIMLGITSLKLFFKNLSTTTDTPTKIFDAISAFVDGINTGKDIAIPITNMNSTGTKKK